MTQCPASIRLWCAPKESGVAGLTLEELAALISPLITASGTSTFVNAGDGGPYVTSDTLDVTALGAGVWRDYGPNGSGATNIWDALDLVPLDAEWIEVKFWNILNGGAVDTNVFSELYARENGSSVISGSGISIVSDARGRTNASGNIQLSSVTYAKIPIDAANIFELNWFKTSTANIISAYLIGYGTNA